MPPKCLRCQRPRRGHVGPMDDDCSMDEPLDPHSDNIGGRGHDPSDSEAEDNDPNYVPPPNGQGALPKVPATPKHKKSAFALKEILHQLGNLSVTVQRISEETKSLTVGQKRQQAEMNVLKHLPTPPHTRGYRLAQLPTLA
jgi:hypothetical protein